MPYERLSASLCAALLLSTAFAAWAGPPPRSERVGVQHSPVERARPGSGIPIQVRVGREMGATRVVVFYRSSEQADYVELSLHRSDTEEWTGAIPADAISGRTVQYYLEVRDARGRAISSAGSLQRPYQVVLSETVQGARVSEVEIDDPEARARQQQQRETEDKHLSRKFDRLFFFVMPGFGFGYQPTGNHTEIAWELQTAPGANARYVRSSVASPGGVTVAPFHLALEVGGLITRHFSLSLIGRFELVTGANADSSGAIDGHGSKRATSAAAGFLRARYLFLEARFHPYLHLDVGGGQIRHALDLSKAQASGALVDRYAAEAFNAMDMSHLATHAVCTPGANCTDSILFGDLFIGGGAGLWYDVAKHVALILDIQVLGALGVGPAAQRGLNADVQFGLGGHFL